LIPQQDRTASSAFSSGVAVEASLLRAAAAAGVPVPDVLGAGEWPETHVGWLVTSWLDGETIPRRLLRDDAWAAARAAIPAQCGTALAAIHSIDPATIPGLPAKDPLADPRPVLDALSSVRPVLELGARWLELHREPSLARTTVHGDFRLGNLLVGPAGLRGVLDWELAHAGDPLEDFGWLCARAWRFGGRGRVAGMGALETVLDAYAAAGGAAIDAASVTWWEAYASIKWAVICAMQASAHLTGAVRSVELAAIGRRVCESEWDLLVLLGWADAAHGEPPLGATSADAAPFGRPSARELVDAVHEQLAEATGSAADDRERYRTRVASNALGIVARELELGPEVTRRHQARLATLGVKDDDELRGALRAGSLDERLEHVGTVLAGSTKDQLLVANPGYLSVVDASG
jgi:aminoglycoside phosphotransferase (APT) family kinase protein